MKLQNLSVIFIIIMIPIIVVATYYMQLQGDTVSMQTSYNTKLLESTKEAVEAFEINTVEWNTAYSTTADSKRRDVMASINSFTTSLSNSLGLSGASREYMLSYVPTIAYTLYDGYYIYSPAKVKKTAVDSNGVTKFDDAGNIIYINAAGGETHVADDAIEEYKHVLKPFASYSERIKDGLKEYIINYTLDNYITIYQYNGSSSLEQKSGYLINLDAARINIKQEPEQVIVDGKNVDSEYLSEEVAIKDDTGEVEVKNYNYIYEASNKIKLYIDDDTDPTNPTFFLTTNSNELINIENLETTYYKKKACYINGNVEEIYQILNGDKKGNWYLKDEINATGQRIPTTEYSKYGIDANIRKDYSAINYYVEAYAFSIWVKNNLATTMNFLDVGNSNDPEKAESLFVQHKREVMQNELNSDLRQAITSYSRNSTGYTYFLPELKETDWDQILTNVSVITFFQGMPIGTKYYNNYSVATSTNNKDFVDPEEIYFENGTDEYYHRELCNKATIGSSYVGYRNIDYIQKTYTKKDNITNISTSYYYYPHEKLGCYSCIVDLASYTKDNSSSNATIKVYNEALARERYITKQKTNEEILTELYEYLTIEGADEIYCGATETYTAKCEGTPVSVDWVITPSEYIKVPTINSGTGISITGEQPGQIKIFAEDDLHRRGNKEVKIKPSKMDSIEGTGSIDIESTGTYSVKFTTGYTDGYIQWILSDETKVEIIDENKEPIGTIGSNEYIATIKIKGLEEVDDLKITAKLVNVEAGNTESKDKYINIINRVVSIEMEPTEWIAYIGGIQLSTEETKPRTDIKITVETVGPVNASKIQEFAKSVDIIRSVEDIIVMDENIKNLSQAGNKITFNKTIIANQTGYTQITAKKDDIESSSCNINVYSAGTGTETDPYRLFYIEDLVDLSNSVNWGNYYSDKFFKMERSLDFLENTHYRNYQDIVTYKGYNSTPEGITIMDVLTNMEYDGFIPIGMYHVKGRFFSGTFDGNDESISNLWEHVKLPGYYNFDTEMLWDNIYGGFFGKISNATIKKLRLENIKIEDYVSSDGTNTSWVGGLVGRMSGTCKIDNCKCTGEIIINGQGTNPPSGIGGIIGALEGTPSYSYIISITNSINEVNITKKMNNEGSSSPSSIGGIAGTLVSNPRNSCNRNRNISIKRNSFNRKL